MHSVLSGLYHNLFNHIFLGGVKAFAGAWMPSDAGEGFREEVTFHSRF